MKRSFLAKHKQVLRSHWLKFFANILVNFYWDTKNAINCAILWYLESFINFTPGQGLEEVTIVLKDLFYAIILNLELTFFDRFSSNLSNENIFIGVFMYHLLLNVTQGKFEIYALTEVK